ncbi:THO complex subunit 2 [Octopus sinensis]|uniref:THO complex subunit 2 n=1 Tax=Octopus sinensis TaxID=2607531 RepID=A0A6P7T1G5_9MOLL|nr:THO complex subunit 2 [Octopus sinensis]
MAAIRVTVEACKNWEKNGKIEFIKFCKGISNVSSLETSDLPFHKALYDLFISVVRGHMKPDHAVSTITEIVDFHKELPSLLASILSIIDVESSCSDDKQQRDRFLLLVSGMVGIVPDCVLKERLDQETLECVGLIQSKQLFQQKYVKTKTKLYYKQQKFNLLREESEGYAKLMSELNQDLSDGIGYLQVLETIKSLIGCFDLDPNRVLDILLESFECRPENEQFFIALFTLYMSEQKTLCHVLGFKFHFYQSAAEDSPDSLYKVAALLLKHNLIELDDLYPHLCPADTSIIEYHQRILLEAKQLARKLSIVCVSDKANEKDKENDNDAKINLQDSNQKLGLCKALLSVGDWLHAKAIMDRLPDYFATSHKPTAQALCALIHSLIEPIYRENTGFPAAVLKRKSKDKIQNLERAGSFLKLHEDVFPMLTYLGPHASYDVILLVKFIRIGKSFMIKRQERKIKPEDDVTFYGFLTILDEVLLPSLTLLPCNCCLSEELWSFLKLFPYELRYRLYGHWKNETYTLHAKMIHAKVNCLERAKYIMKRLSKENVKPSGRQLGKLSHSNPGVLFEYVLSQIQKYDNFIVPVVDSLKYLTSLSYDVLAYSVVEAVANPDRERLKHDDTNISLWLQSLASFAGSVCRKYPVELAGLMQYVANQLKAGKSFDLLLLREIVQKMAGIEISEEITDDQLEAMSGGELLRQEGGYFAQVRNTKKSSTRLKDALLEHDLALSLCLLMAQQRDGVIYKEGNERHLKLTGKLYDQCQDTLVQFGSFLSMQLSTEEFIKRLPPINELIGVYHVPQDAAFFLCRPLYSYRVNTKFEELKKAEKSSKQFSSQQKTQKYVEASSLVMEPVIELIRPLYPAKVWDDLSTPFYFTFWALCMYDLHVPRTAYEKQIQQLKAQIVAIDENDLPQSKKKKDKERCTSLIEKLMDEEKKQSDHVQRVMARLKHDKDSWFLCRSTKNEMITQFLQLCIFPRCCLTASDALYCAKFIYILHEQKTPNFSTLICCDRIFCDITYTVTSCTENEAHRYGRFLCAALETILKWHSDKVTYEKECANYPGFVSVIRKGSDNINKADQLDYENYRHVCHKWHFRITKAMVACLESRNYIQIRNSLIILTKILPYYPRIMQFGQALERRVNRIRQEEKEKRPDIYALAMGYSGQLKNKKSMWVPEHEFHIKNKEAPKNQTKSTSHSSKHDISRKSMENKTRDGKEIKEIKKEKNDKKVDKIEPVVEGRSKPNLAADLKKNDFDKKPSVSALKEERNPLKERGTSKERSPEKNSDKENRHKEEKRHSKSHEEKIVTKERLSGSKEKTTSKEKSEEKKLRKQEKDDEKYEEKKIKESYYKEKDIGSSGSSSSSRYNEKPSTMVASGGGSCNQHRRSAETSPKHADDREAKRRKLESASSTSTKSPSSEKEREYYEEKKKEKKRDISSDRSSVEVKKRKGNSKLNGESVELQLSSSSMSKEEHRRQEKQFSKHDSSEKERSKRESRSGEDEYREKVKDKEKERVKRADKEKVSSKKLKK